MRAQGFSLRVLRVLRASLNIPSPFPSTMEQIEAVEPLEGDYTPPMMLLSFPGGTSTMFGLLSKGYRGALHTFVRTIQRQEGKSKKFKGNLKEPRLQDTGETSTARPPDLSCSFALLLPTAPGNAYSTLQSKMRHFSVPSRVGNFSNIRCKALIHFSTWTNVMWQFALPAHDLPEAIPLTTLHRHQTLKWSFLHLYV